MKEYKDEKYRKDELCTAEWLHVIDVLLNHGIRAFSLTGGEAVLREDLKTIISYIYDHTPRTFWLCRSRDSDTS